MREGTYPVTATRGRHRHTFISEQLRQLLIEESITAPFILARMQSMAALAAAPHLNTTLVLQQYHEAAGLAVQALPAYMVPVMAVAGNSKEELKKRYDAKKAELEAEARKFDEQLHG